MNHKNIWQRIILALFHFLLFVLPFYFSFSTQELFEFNKIILVYFVTTLIAATWIMRMIQEKRVMFKRTYLDIPLLIFLFSQIISTVLSMHPRTSLLGYYSRFNGGLLSLVSYYILYYAFVSNLSTKNIKQLLYPLLISSGIISIYAILEHYGHSVSCLIASGGTDFGVQCWKQKVQERVFASFGQPNWLSAYTIMLVPTSLYLTITTDRSKLLKKILTYTIGSLLILATIFTGSRSGFLGLIGGLLVFVTGTVIYFAKNALKPSNFTPHFYLSRRVTQYTFGLIGLLIVLSLVFGTPYTPSLGKLIASSGNSQSESHSNRDTTPQMELGGTDSAEIRKIVWKGTLNIWKRYPLFGSGVETFAYSYYKDRLAEHNLVSEWDFLYNKAHNEFLNYLATTGLVGLSSYLLLLGWFGISASKQIIRSNSLIHLMLLSSITALSISNFFGFSTVTVSALMFIFFAISSLITDFENNQNKKSPPNQTSHKKYSQRTTKLRLNLSLQYFLATILGICTVFAVYKIYNYRQADVYFNLAKQMSSDSKTLESVDYFKKAIQASPNEAIYYDELAHIYSSIAVATKGDDGSTTAAQLGQIAVELSNKAIALNPVHLNFLKTRARILISLSQIQPDLLEHAKSVLEDATELAPTDAKLWYNLGLVEASLGDEEGALKSQQEAVELKSNYESARIELARLYLQADQPEKAREQYSYVLDHISADNPTALEGLLLTDDDRVKEDKE